MWVGIGHACVHVCRFVVSVEMYKPQETDVDSLNMIAMQKPEACVKVACVKNRLEFVDVSQAPSYNLNCVCFTFKNNYQYLFYFDILNHWRVVASAKQRINQWLSHRFAGRKGLHSAGITSPFEPLRYLTTEGMSASSHRSPMGYSANNSQSGLFTATCQLYKVRVTLKMGQKTDVTNLSSVAQFHRLKTTTPTTFFWTHEWLHIMNLVICLKHVKLHSSIKQCCRSLYFEIF